MLFASRLQYSPIVRLRTQTNRHSLAQAAASHHRFVLRAHEVPNRRGKLTELREDGDV